MAEMSYVYAGTVRSAAGVSGGIFRQNAGDQRWEALTNGLPDETQVHAITVHPANPEVVFIGTTKGAFRSDDRGAHWHDIEVGRFSPLTYGRDLRVSPHDPNVLYAALSPAFSSSDGGIFRSDDVGRTWKRFDHEVKAEATMMAVAVHPRDPQQVVGVSKTGQVFTTGDGGGSWSGQRLPAGAGDR